VQVLRDRRGYNVDCSANKFEVTMELMGGRPTLNQHDFLLFGKGGSSLPVESPSGFLPLAKVPVVMSFFIMVHSFSLCLTGYV
jgi:hypothetical protein